MLDKVAFEHPAVSPRHFPGEPFPCRGAALHVERKAPLVNEALHEDRECFG